MVNGVEELLDIKVQHPVLLLAAVSAAQRAPVSSSAPALVRATWRVVRVGGGSVR
jgi:hypothetical protein